MGTKNYPQQLTFTTESVVRDDLDERDDPLLDRLRSPCGLGFCAFSEDGLLRGRHELLDLLPLLLRLLPFFPFSA